MYKKIAPFLVLSVGSFLLGRAMAPKVSLIRLPDATVSSSSGKIGKINDLVLTESDLPKELSSRLYQIRMQEHELLSKQFKSFVFDSLVSKYSVEKKVSRQDYIKELFSSVKEPSQSQVNEFSKKFNIDLSKDKTLIERIKAKLKEDEIEKKKENFTSSLISKNNGNIEVYFSRPRYTFSLEKDQSPKLGQITAKNKIVLFRDLSKDDGKRLTSLAESLTKKSDSVLVYKDFSSSRSPEGDSRVQAQLCVYEKLGLEKYREKAEELARYSGESLEKEIASSGKDLVECLKSNRHQLQARSNLIQVLGTGTTGRSTLVVNGVVLIEETMDSASRHLQN
jgi:hypothetical protein